MEKTYYSILNDALGPIMTGPSSSHSAGCCRIGNVARSLFGRDIVKADVVFEENGSYPSTYIGQGSDFGFTGGLLGYHTDDPRLKDAVKTAAFEKREIAFKKESLGLIHPNQAEIRIYDEDDNTELTLMTFSVGGGMFEITKLNGFDVHITGGENLAFVFAPASSEEISQLLITQGYEYIRETKDSETLFTIKTEEKIDELKSVLTSDVTVRYAPAVLPVVLSKNIPPFHNAEEAVIYAKKHSKKPYELAYDYETAYGKITPKEIDLKIRRIKEAMEASTVPPDPDETEIYGFLQYKGKLMANKLPETAVIDTGILNKAMLAAVSVMENSCAHNIIVAAPTAGSSGVIPAGIVTIGHESGKNDEEIEKALLVAGLTGVFIANNATFAGETGACQAENGSASAMAAAGITYLLGGNTEDVFKAASMALQNMLGLICDPVAGLTEIPCISRNVSALSNAIMSANMVVLGFDPVIPFDETVKTMKKVGEQLPAELRCTCGGGLCTSPTGCMLQKKLESTRKTI